MCCVVCRALVAKRVLNGPGPLVILVANCGSEGNDGGGTVRGHATIAKRGPYLRIDVN
jgi:hypothetical protein